MFSTSYYFLLIDDVIGLRGIQLFVDAGIPVDRQLIADMTQSVIMERLESMFGFPEPGMGDRGNIVRPLLLFLFFIYFSL